MNRLSLDKQTAVLAALVEGNSIRSISRMTGVHKTTITSLLSSVGHDCERLMDRTMRNLTCQNLQADEVWAYVGKKQGHVTPQDRVEHPDLGDIYIFVALDADSKLIPCFAVGKRNIYTTQRFMFDLKNRVNGKIQLTTDTFLPYREAVYYAFGIDIDFAQLQKKYAADRGEEHRYSPPKITAVFHDIVTGYPNTAKISTSFVERQNLTMRMQMRRLTRLTNAFSKKLENLKAAVALHFAHYNFCRIHQSLRVTLAIETGVTNHLGSIGDSLQYGN
jgi:IS1 family transposase